MSCADRGTSARQGTAHVDESVWTVLRCEEVMVHPCEAAHQILAWMLTDLTEETVAIGSVSVVV